jgi:23S rRNA (guanosine2251-2'-O)-methyltransferase
LVFGVQPVQELLAGRPCDVERIYVARDAKGTVGRIVRAARHTGIPVTHLDRERLASKVGRRGSHQGIAALVAPVPYSTLDELVARARAKADGVLVLVDRVTDPGNLGSILRTCAAAGVDGVLLSRDGTAGLTPHAVKASAGAIERVRVARVPAPGRLVQELRKVGFGALVLAPTGEVSWDRLDLSGRILLVAGGEERGPRPGVVAACDTKVAIPLEEGIDSLNVAVATAVILFEARRQRRGANPGT